MNNHQISKIQSVAIGLLVALLSQNVAAEEWKERWVFAYAGEQGGRSITTPWNELGIKVHYEFDNALYLSGNYHLSKEQSGGIDNNAQNHNATVAGIGYAFNLGETSKLKVGYQYANINIKNVQMGGVRVGTYIDKSISGHGPVLRLTHKVTPDFTADIALSQHKYTTGFTNTHTEIAASYNFNPNLFGRVEYLLIDRSGWHSNMWTVGLGYNF